MSIFKHNLSKRTKRNLILVAVVVLLCVAYLIFDIAQNGPLTRLLSEKDTIIDFVQSMGALGPLAFIFVQILQTVVAPLPGNVAAIVGGVLFGWWGILWSTIGGLIGYWIVFSLARKFGRGLVEKVVKKSVLDKFDYLTSEKGSLIFFLFFLIPGLPDDAIGYIAGLTEIPIRKLLVMMVIGRTPAVIASNMIGAGIGDDNIQVVAIVTAISAILLVFVFIKSEQIFAWLNKTSTDK